MDIFKAILKDIITDKLGNDIQFDKEKITDDFLLNFSKSLCEFEKNAVPLYNAIYSLDLIDPENAILQIESIYNAFINEIAENFVLGRSSEISNLLVNAGNKLFLDRVNYFKNLSNVIKKIERKRIKEALPKSYEALTFEIDDEDLELIVKKQAREDLRLKLKQWDKELIPANEVSINTSYNTFEKSSNFSWIQYSLAACVLFILGFWGIYILNQDSVFDNSIEVSQTDLNKSPKQDEIKLLKSIRLASIRTNYKTVNLVESYSPGFVKTQPKIKIVISNSEARITSINNLLIRLRELYNKRGASKNLTSKDELKNKIELLNKELINLKSLKDTYEFNGTELKLNKTIPANTQILLSNNSYYLNINKGFFPLLISKQSRTLQKLSNPTEIEALNKILFENGY
jgi:hypothetical protein